MAMDILKNTGVILEEPKESDLFFGANDRVKHNIKLEDRNWLKYYSSGELQYATDDTMSCVTFAAIKEISAKFNYRIQNNLLLKANIIWLKEKGYINDKGEFDASERFTSAMSGTTEDGNSGGRVFDSIRNHGLVPQHTCPWNGESGEWFRDKANISQEAIDLGKEFKARFEIFYERIRMDVRDKLLEALLYSPIEVYIPTSCPYENTIQQYCDGNIGHAVSLCDDLEPRGYWPLFDHYIKQPQEEGNERFIRRVVENYKFYPTGFVSEIEEKQEELHDKPFTLIKQHGIPDIYFYGYDKMWHGFDEMEVLDTFIENYNNNLIKYVDVLPSNISYTLSKK